MKRGIKLLNLAGLILFFYLFIFSIVLIRNSFFEIGGDILHFSRDNLHPINAFGLGWLITLIMQSSGPSTAAFMALHVAGIIGPVILVYMVIGTRIGTAVTSLFISLLAHTKKRRDFRHGFEIGLANLVYVFPIAVLMFLLEYFLGLFSGIGNYFVSLDIPLKLNVIDVITKPLVNLVSFLPEFALVGAGIFLLIASLREIPKYLLGFWGEQNLRNNINKYLDKKYKAFFIGFFITAILLSTSITVSLLIPLVVLRIINLKKVIPYMIGANLGGVIDIVISALVIGEKAFPALLVYVSFSVIGLLWLFNTDLLFNITKYISKRTLQISRKRAFIFLLDFILLAIILAMF